MAGIRLATDLKFYDERAKLDERWMKNFYLGDGLSYREGKGGKEIGCYN